MAQGPTTSELWRWDAADLARAIRLGVISSREATESCLARLDRVNPAINAVVSVQREAALAAAAAADAALRRGEAPGPLHGVPVTTKINIDQQGLPTTNGVVAFAQQIAPSDSPVVANLKRAGAVLLGRTNTPAFSFRWFTENDLHGRTLNPWHAGITPGGSSGGAAAAVAAGIGPIAHGNDMGGSVRYPAYACGVAGLRPSAGRVPSYNETQPAERPISMQFTSVQGPLARRVGDLRLALAAMAQGDLRDPWWMPVPLAFPSPPRPIRVALSLDAGGVGPHPAVVAALRQAAAWLEAAGYAVEETATPDMGAAAEDWAALALTEARLGLWPAMQSHGDAGGRATLGWMLELTPPLDLPGVLAVAARRVGHQRRWAAFLAEHPLLLCPVSAEPPFPQGLDASSAESMRRVAHAQGPMLGPALMGLPCISVPTGLVEGVPMGVQLIAARFREDLLLDAAEAIEARAPMPTPIDPVA